MTERTCDAVIDLLPCAAVGLRVDAGAVTDIRFLPPGTPLRAPTAPAAVRACEALRAWLDDPTRPIELPLAVDGSEFQRRVWAAIARIPSGRTRTYGELAAELGSTARAVGQACGDNRLPLAIPCHRVTASRGLGGFAHHSDGPILAVKRWLLAHESRATFSLVP